MGSLWKEVIIRKEKRIPMAETGRSLREVREDKYGIDFKGQKILSEMKERWIKKVKMT